MLRSNFELILIQVKVSITPIILLSNEIGELPNSDSHLQSFQKQKRNKAVNRELTPDNVVHTMTSFERNWRIIHQLVRKIMSKKEKEEIPRIYGRDQFPEKKKGI